MTGTLLTQMQHFKNVSCVHRTENMKGLELMCRGRNVLCMLFCGRGACQCGVETVFRMRRMGVLGIAGGRGDVDV